jgi:hypothetical protein
LSIQGDLVKNFNHRDLFPFFSQVFGDFATDGPAADDQEVVPDHGDVLEDVLAAAHEHDAFERLARRILARQRKDMRQIWCACHNGTYDLNGGNVSGPPPKPLTVFVVNVSGDDIGAPGQLDGWAFPSGEARHIQPVLEDLG